MNPEEHRARQTLHATAALASEDTEARFARATGDYLDALGWKNELKAAAGQIAAELEALALWKAADPVQARATQGGSSLYKRLHAEFADRQARIQKKLAKAREAVCRTQVERDKTARAERPIPGARYVRDEPSMYVWLADVRKGTVARSATSEVRLDYNAAGRIVGIQIQGEACGAGPA